MSRAFCICVPARNEVGHIAILIEALARQSVAGPIPIALCINNSDDGTVQAAHQAAAASRRIVLNIVERDFPADLAHAGSARRAAMDLGAHVLDSDQAVLLSTDADCNPPPGWIAETLRHMDEEDRIVGGRIELDEVEELPPGLIEIRRRFDLYWTRVRAIEDAIDPVPWDVPPRHGDHTGASLALTVGLYRKAGGVPLLPTGEDRALVAAAIEAGGKLVHPASVWTRASPRIVGRATSGMAMDMQRLTHMLEAGTTPVVPHFDHWRARAEWRRRTRRAHMDNLLPRFEALLPPMPCDMPLPHEQVEDA